MRAKPDTSVDIGRLDRENNSKSSDGNKNSDLMWKSEKKMNSDA